MKHLQKFNESISDFDNLYQYCQDVFADMIDDGIVEINVNESILNPAYKQITIFIKKGKYINSKFYCSFIKRIEKYKEWINILEDVNVALKRLNDKYPFEKINMDTIDDNIDFLIFKISLK